MREPISIERLRELLDYDPASGEFVWRVRRGGSAKSGSIAGTVHPDGYTSILIDRRAYLAHRLAWFYVHEKWPAEQIDHINGIRDDNRLANIREATSYQNAQNVLMFCTNQSGFKGVDHHHGKWRARIRAAGRAWYLGHFAMKEEAAAAYRTAAGDLHGAFARTA